MKTCIQCGIKKANAEFISRRGSDTERCLECRGNLKPNVWQNDKGNWCRHCPCCHKAVCYDSEYSSAKYAVQVAVQKKQLCQRCAIKNRPKHYAKKTPVIDLSSPLPVGTIKTISINVQGRYFVPIQFMVRNLQCSCGWQRVLSIPLMFDSWNCYQCRKELTFQPSVASCP
jgi:hypothetical protein